MHQTKLHILYVLSMQTTQEIKSFNSHFDSKLYLENQTPNDIGGASIMDRLIFTIVFMLTCQVIITCTVTHNIFN